MVISNPNTLSKQMVYVVCLRVSNHGHFTVTLNFFFWPWYFTSFEFIMLLKKRIYHAIP
uniref:Uncharacterized protein n=1 Tax=Arundo donax TaxID=35708 RepID=A0A0A9D144_ARUDO